MGLFDFLKPADSSQFQIDPAVAQGLLSGAGGGGPAPAPAPPPDPSQAPVAPPGAAAGPPQALNPADFMPPQQPSGMGAPGGLLNRLTSNSPDGLTFADKLMATGSFLKGDSGGAMSYLQQQKNAAKATQTAQQATALRMLQNKALAMSYRNGVFDPATYAALSGSSMNPDTMMAMQKVMQPKIVAGSDKGFVSQGFGPDGQPIVKQLEDPKPPDEEAAALKTANLDVIPNPKYGQTGEPRFIPNPQKVGYQTGVAMGRGQAHQTYYPKAAGRGAANTGGLSAGEKWVN
jgi:hypothetical protein